MKNLAEAIHLTATYEWHLIVCRMMPGRKALTKDEFRDWATTRTRTSPFF